MSRYHEKCAEHSKPQAPRSRKLTSKPFCDCRCCTCPSCPDILKMLSIRVTDSTVRFGPKVPCDNKSDGSDEQIELTNLLEVLNPDRDCSCDVVAKGIREHDVHKNIGMSERRDNISNFDDVFDGLSGPSDSRTSKSSKTTVAKKCRKVTIKHRVCDKTDSPAPPKTK